MASEYFILIFLNINLFNAEHHTSEKNKKKMFLLNNLRECNAKKSVNDFIMKVNVNTLNSCHLINIDWRTLHWLLTAWYLCKLHNYHYRKRPICSIATFIQNMNDYICKNMLYTKSAYNRITNFSKRMFINEWII
jgi:hypothetical protein